jgi:hypothetical protein
MVSVGGCHRGDPGSPRGCIIMRALRSPTMLAAAVAGSALLAASVPAAGATVKARTADASAAHAPRVPTRTADAPPAEASILAMPATVRVSDDLGHINVRVRYLCANTSDVQYYLLGAIHQDTVPPGPDYSIGFRNAGGLVLARCTGRQVTATLRLRHDDWWGAPAPEPQLHAGQATITFLLDAKAVPSGGGWATDKDPDAFVTGTVNVLTP